MGVQAVARSTPLTCSYPAARHLACMPQRGFNHPPSTTRQHHREDGSAAHKGEDGGSASRAPPGRFRLGCVG